MYNLTRQEASEILGISTRSIDRYIKSGKIRAKKDWKIVYLNKADVENLSPWDKKVAEVIIPKKQKEIVSEINEIQNNSYNEANNNSNNRWIVKKSEIDKISATFEKMFNDLRNENKEKDRVIQWLSVKLWRYEEINKNSIPVIEYKKSQFLLEQSKVSLNNEVFEIKSQKTNLEKKLNYEKTTNKLLIAFVVILFIILWVVFFIKI